MPQLPNQTHRYITTVTGQNIGYPKPFAENAFLPKHVRLEDIRSSLAKMCRYNGHVDRFYSVAEHSVLVSRIAELLGDTEAIVPALLHDAHEAYMGDIASPQKSMIVGAEEFETLMESVVRAAFDLPDRDSDVWRRVDSYDKMILPRELKNLRIILPDWYDPHMESKVPAEVQPIGFEWPEAQALFRHRLREFDVRTRI